MSLRRGNDCLYYKSSISFMTMLLFLQMVSGENISPYSGILIGGMDFVTAFRIGIGIVTILILAFCFAVRAITSV